MPGSNAATAGRLDFRKLFESSPGLYLVLDPELTIVGASDAYLRATMTEREAIVGHNLYEIFPDNPDSSEHARGSGNLSASLQHVLRDHVPDVRPVQRYDIRLPADQGGAFVTRYWSPANLPILGPEGELLWILHCVEDVTGFVRVMREQGCGDALVGEGGAHDPAELQRDAERANTTLARLARGLEQCVAERTAELAAANQKLEIELADRAMLEQQFRQAQKMEAVGRLAGGVAHDFNNLLTVIQGYGDLLLAAEADPRKRARLEQMAKAAGRAVALTRQLLAFSRQQVLDLRVLDLNAGIADVSSMLRRLIGEDIELATVLAPDLGHVKADAGQIEQVLMNLAVNARDAMPDGGQLTIETANVVLDQGYAGRHGAAVRPGPYVMLAVSDTGIGMDAATKEKIFEPFFTTKEKGKGTGLGLAMVYGFIKQCGGNIWLYSEPGSGTCFKIYLPRVDAAVAETAAASPAERVSGTETVLLVEDEENVREFAREALSESGYRLLEAGDGAQALALLAAAPGSIHLVITDLVLPGMSGRELAERARAAHPAMRLMFISGYTDDAALRRGIAGGGALFLQKPFRAPDLLAKIRQALDAPV